MSMVVAAAGALGLIVGSFLNVLVIRRGALTLSGRSACLSCGAQIRWYDNIPVFSWLALGGKCRACGSSISIQYPVVEATTAVLFATVAYALAPSILDIELADAVLLLLHGLLVALLVAIAVYDVRHTIIPDTWAYAAAATALLLALFVRPESIPLTLLAGPAAALPLFALWYISGGRWMGLGDAKLALSIGFFLGPLYGPVAILYSFIVGAVVSVCILLPLPYVLRALRQQGISGLGSAQARFTMKSEVGFGPFLVAAFFIVWFSLLFNTTLPLMPL